MAVGLTQNSTDCLKVQVGHRHSVGHVNASLSLLAVDNLGRLLVEPDSKAFYFFLSSTTMSVPPGSG
jgi:hypothetical protein